MKVEPNETIEPFVDDLVDWIFEHLTPGHRALAAQQTIADITDMQYLLADLRVQLLQEMVKEGATHGRIAKVLGISVPTVKRLLSKANKARSKGDGYSGNRTAQVARMTAVRRKYGWTAAERAANGYTGAPKRP